MTNLAKRVLFALPAAVFFLYVTWLGGWYFHALIAAVGLLVQHEVLNIAEEAGNKPNKPFAWAFAAWLLAFPMLPDSLYWGLGLFLLYVIVEVFNQSDTAIPELSSTLFYGFYAPFGMLTFVLIRNTGGSDAGFALMLSLLLMVWGNDTFAYFTGRAFGKHLFAPHISPKKTWEGFFGGFAGALVGLLISYYVIPFDFPFALAVAWPLVLLISVCGPIGDLTESKLKRAAGVKDSSNLLPGHGGFFDRFDALLLAAPAYYLYLKILVFLGYAAF